MTEKFNIFEEQDFKEWETYHIFERVRPEAELDQNLLPQHIKTMISVREGQSVPIHRILNIKGGSKYGKKISNPDIKWTEEWYECGILDDTLGDNPTQVKLRIKFFSKLWTNVEACTIEGESCFQVLDRHQVLQYEMKDNLKTDNILNKEGSLKYKTIQVKKLAPARDGSFDEGPGESFSPEEDIANPNFDLFQHTNVQPIDFTKVDEVKPQFEEKIVYKLIPDNHINDPTPLKDRSLKTHLVQRFLTQFAGSHKVREEGIEHFWTSPT